MSVRLSTGLSPRLLRGSCRRRCRGSRPPASSRGDGDGRRLRQIVARSRRLQRFRQARSRAPSRCRRRATLMLAGFRSRWMMPCSCAASSASAICRAIGSASSSGIGPLRDAIGQRRPFDQLHDERRRRRRTLRTRRSRQCSDDSARRDFGFALEARKPIRIARKRSGRTLMATSRFSFVSRGAIDLAHAAGADLGSDLDRDRGACRGQGPDFRGL